MDRLERFRTWCFTGILLAPCCVFLAPFALLGGWYFTAVPSDVQGRIKIGMTKQEVVNVAGRPSYRSEADSAIRVHHDDYWTYRVRYHSGFGVYSDPLTVFFDKEGRCAGTAQ